MPTVDISLELLPTVLPLDIYLPCLVCTRCGCEWKVRLPTGAAARECGLHGACKVLVERRRPSQQLEAVKST